MLTKNELLVFLKERGINYKKYSHPPIENVSDAEKHAESISGARCKNLFLVDSKGETYLLIVSEEKKVSFKNLARQLNKRLSFASKELLEKTLRIQPGCVSLFALVNDVYTEAVVLLDVDIMKEKEVSFHPLINTETLTIDVMDMLRFIDATGHRNILVDI